jgi:hypothetical protein
MIQGGSYPIEEFLEAITAQLDKTQDALRLKSVNRPLTFALKDFTMDLQVFVEMDEQGQIRFRPSRPNEQGSSTVNIGFTTITRPMIEENTVSMELSKSPTLEEVGLAPEERRQLERLGVRNAAQLKRLESQAGDSDLSRMSGVNVAKLRQALQMGRPHINQIEVENEAPIKNPSAGHPVSTSPDSHIGGRQAPAGIINRGQKIDHDRLRQKYITGTNNDGDHQRPSGRIQIEEVADRPVENRTLPRLNISERARKLKLHGGNLLEAGKTPRAKLNQRELSISQGHENEVVVDLPERHTGGVLEIELPDGNHEIYELVVDTSSPDAASSDPWMPSMD